MGQISKTRSVVYHLYPGLIILLFFVLVTPILVEHNYPPQAGILLSIIVAALPLFILHLRKVKNKRMGNKGGTINGFTHKLPAGRLSLYVAGLVVFGFLIWGLTQPLNEIITAKVFDWLPNWFTTTDFKGYSKDIILFILILNLVVNGIIAPVVEEYYFRGYLLSRMQAWGKWAFVINALLFTIYHFWQPQVWLSLIPSLLAMTYVVWKTKDLRVAIYTHCLWNLIGALLSFGLLKK